MQRELKRLGVVAAVLVIAIFVVIIFNQIVQLSAAAERIHPTLGAATFWGLLALLVGLAAAPVILYFRLPQPLELPDDNDPEALSSYRHKLAGRLAANPYLAGRSLEDPDELEAALADLSQRADEIIRNKAGVIFLSTAISQSGRLDGLVVLAVQSRLIWEVARLYYQRPTLRDLLRLYRDVAVTALVAASIEEIDVGEQIEPVLAGAMAPLAGAIPGLQTVSALVAESLVVGSANAFLTLRVGALTKRFCGALERQPRGVLRRSASAEAAGMLGGIVAAGSKQIVKATGRAVKSRFGRAVDKAAWWKSPEPETS